MGYNDLYRFGAHAMIFNAEGQVLTLKRTYADKGWGLPGGAADPGETIHQTLYRECREELGLDVHDAVLTGVYYHRAINAQVAIFRCSIAAGARIQLSPEHSEYRWSPLSELSEIQRIRAEDALNYKGQVVSRAF